MSLFLKIVFRLKKWYERGRKSSGRAVTIVPCVSGLRSTLTIMAKALNCKPRSLTLLIIVLPRTHVGWYHLPQVLIEGFIIDCKPIDRSGDISWNEDVVERH